jgi:diguanylate cyclase (GGDEF)-like protein
MMKPTDQSLADQMHLHEVEIARRKELFGLTQEDGGHLSVARSAILEDIEAIVDEFYERQTSIPEVAVVIGDRETLERLHAAQRTYVGELFSGCYDRDYVNSRLRVGLVHKRIGVEPKYFFAAVKVLRDILRRALSDRLAESPRLPATLDALDKVLCFDAELIFETYMQTVLSELEATRDQMIQYARGLEEKVAQRTRELAELSRTDALTGLLNRRAFLDDLHRELARAKRNAAALTLVCFDVDGFKLVNDAHGHQKGDALLNVIGTEVLALTREVDIASRYGGDEFLVGLPDTDLIGAQLFMERLAARIEGRTGLTISVGIVQTGPERFQGVDEFVQRADLAMYDSKRHRKVAESPAPGSPDTSAGTGVDLAERGQLTTLPFGSPPRRTRRA